MDKYKLMDLIYDKLADNDEMEQFDHHEHADEMCVVNDWQNGGEPKIAIVYEGKEFVLSIKENVKPSEWQVYEPTYSDRVREGQND